MKTYFKLMAFVALALLPIGCGDDGEEPGAPSVAVELRDQSVAEGSEVDAVSTTEITLTYNVPVSIAATADITLNGERVKASANPHNQAAIVIPVALTEGTSYRLKLSVGSVVAKSEPTAVAPELILNFSTKKAYQKGNIATMPLTANPDAVRLYRYIYSQYGEKILSSVMANVNWNNDCAEKVFKLTGKYPAMNCYDFIHIYVPQNNWIDYTDIGPVERWAKAGGLVQLMWHFNVPISESTTPGSDGSGVTCTPSETSFKASNVLKDGTWENRWFYEQMDKVVATLLKLQEAGIAATWRPFHEAAGNATHKVQANWTKSWFWWGYDGAETYKKLWVTMYDYFKQKGINNLIWVWTTQNYNGNSDAYYQDTDWYPGDAYVDIVGRDLYGQNAQVNAQEFAEVQAVYPNKMVALAECGRGDNGEQGRIGECWSKGAKWSHFMVWYQGGQGSTDTMCSDDWWKAAMSDENVITRDQVKL